MLMLLCFLKAWGLEFMVSALWVSGLGFLEWGAGVPLREPLKGTLTEPCKKPREPNTP